MNGKTPRGIPFSGAIALLLAIISAAGCPGREQGHIVRVDSLVTEQERLMLARYIPPGMEESSARLALPRLGPRDPQTGTATQASTVLGQPAILEVVLRDGVVERCGYRLACADSAIAAVLYHELQRIYTAQMGNYHEEFAAPGRPAQSLWASHDHRLSLTLSARAGEYTLVWHFTAVPRTGEPSAAPAAARRARSTTVLQPNADPFSWRTST